MTARPRCLAARPILCSLVLVAVLAGRPAISAGGGGPPSTTASQADTAHALDCVGNAHNAIRIVRVASLDLATPAATKDRSSSVRRAPIPPEVVASGVIPPICVTKDSVTFTRVGTGDPLRIPLNDNPSLAKSASVSPNGAFATVRTTFNAGAVLSPEEADKAEGGEFPMTVTVYGRSGAPLFTTTGTSADLVQVTNGGAVIVSDVWTGQSLVASSATTSTRIPGIGYGGSEYAVNADGSRIVVASKQQMLGTTPADLVAGWPVDWRLRQAATRHVIVALFDGGGRQLWFRSFPDMNFLDDLEISDDGTRVLLAASDYDEPQDMRLSSTFRRGAGYLLDERGEIVASGGWPSVNVIRRFDAGLGAFELGWFDSVDPVFLDLSGQVREIQPPIPRLIEGVWCASRAHSADLTAYAIWRKRHPVLIVSDASGHVLGCHSIQDLVSPVPAGVEDPANQKETLPPIQISMAGMYLSVFSPPSITVFRLELRLRPQAPASKGGSR